MSNLFSKVSDDNSISGIIRTKPDDFKVNEIQNFVASGEGEHIWLHIKKIGENTDWVAGQLAKIANVKRRDVSYAGKKDRNAVTTQWFSIHLPGRVAPDWQSYLSKTISILDHQRHTKKLKRGTLAGNQFEITVRDFKGSEIQLNKEIERISLEGVPNYYGEQRFGFWNKEHAKGNNILKAEQWFSQGYKIKDRNTRGMYLSAARSWIFNHILSQRVTDHSWNRATEGDVFMLNGSQSCFYEHLNDDLIERVNDHDLHPTGALWGRGSLQTQDCVAELEKSQAGTHAILSEGLEKNGLKQERRSLRLLVNNLSYKMHDSTTVTLCFDLPAGAYATTVLSEIGCFKNA